MDAIEEATVEDFVKWLRGQKRVRNGAAKGKRNVYKVGGVRFILSTCRTAFNWAGRHRMLPPFAQNPLTLFRIDRLTDDTEKITKAQIFSPEQERAFFEACNDWQRDLFHTLAHYGLRVGELTHLLIEDVRLSRLGRLSGREWRRSWPTLRQQTPMRVSASSGKRSCGAVGPWGRFPRSDCAASF